MSLRDALIYEARVQAGLMEHGNFREGFQAFVEKRNANFT